MKPSNTQIIFGSIVILLIVYVFVLVNQEKTAIDGSESRKMYQDLIERQKAEYEAEIDRLSKIYIVQDSIIKSLKDSLYIYDKEISDAQLDGSRITIKRLPNDRSVVELSRLLSEADSVRGRFRDFRADSVRWKNQIRNRMEH